MELDILEITDLLEAPSKEITECYEGLVEALEQPGPELVERGGLLATELVEAGKEVLGEALGNLIQEVEDAGVMEALANVLESVDGLVEAIGRGVEALINEFPVEELARLAVVLAIVAIEPEILAEHPELLRLLLTSSLEAPVNTP